MLAKLVMTVRPTPGEVGAAGRLGLGKGIVTRLPTIPSMAVRLDWVHYGRKAGGGAASHDGTHEGCRPAGAGDRRRRL